MKTVLLAGGLGSRLAEETELRPKPMVEIGGRPILWHIMKLYAHHGFREFIVALGYKGDFIKRWFLEYARLTSDLTIDLAAGRVTTSGPVADDWRVHLVDTGQSTLTGGRVWRLRDRLRDGTFMVTYGDGVANVDIGALVDFHRRHGRVATLTAVRPPARYGGLTFDREMITQFTEKPQTGEGWINGGFLVLEPQIFEYLSHDQQSLESDALERLAADGQLAAFQHGDFWQCMDTLREKRLLESLWESDRAPWKLWP